MVSTSCHKEPGKRKEGGRRGRCRAGPTSAPRDRPTSQTSPQGWDVMGRSQYEPGSLLPGSFLSSNSPFIGILVQPVGAKKVQCQDFHSSCWERGSSHWTHQRAQKQKSEGLQSLIGIPPWVSNQTGNSRQIRVVPQETDSENHRDLHRGLTRMCLIINASGE